MSVSLLWGKRVVTTPFIECYFSSVLWPLARDVWWIICLQYYIYGSHPWYSRLLATFEADDAILRIMEKVWGTISECNMLCGRGHGACVATPLQEVSTSKWGRVWLGSSLAPTSCKIWHGLHESSYCYHDTLHVQAHVTIKAERKQAINNSIIIYNNHTQ